MAKRFEQAYKIERGDNLGDAETWNKRFEDIDLRLHARELDGAKIDGAVEELTAAALQRLNDTFTPVIEQAFDQLRTLGAVFAAESLSENEIGAGEKSYVLTPETRAGYVVTAFVSIRPTGYADRGFIANVVNYERGAGLLTVLPVEGHIIGEGTYSSWSVRLTAAPDVEHSTRTDNPHQTTAAQVGAYTEDEVNTLLSAKAPLNAPALVNPTATTPATNDNTTKIATTAMVQAALGNRLRLDAAQSFTSGQQIQGLANLGIQSGFSGLFRKLDASSVAFTKTGAGTISIKAGTIVELAGLIYNFASDTAVQMPSLSGGTDYAIYLCNDGTVRADPSFSAPSGFSTTTSRQIGGFHYAPGGNAAAQAGGDTTPAINAYSIWDLKWRPACADPRGMALVAGRFWVDIYLCGVDHYANGTSRYNVTIADGSSPPKIPAAFGGNGSTAYGSFTWWEASEVMQSAGKDLLSYEEFCAAAYGTTENSSGGTDPVSTILRAAYTSKWGVMLATGNMWVWGNEFGGPDAGASWADTNGGRGQVYQQSNTVLLGGHWNDAASSGSRASIWNIAPSLSADSIGARGRCDHLHHV